MSRGDDDPTAEVVDFDALHAALGDLPPPPSSSKLVAPPMIGESQGRPNAAYSSIRPHAIPVTRPPATDDRTAPAVIVATDDTLPTGAPPQMTLPLGTRLPGSRPPPVPTRPKPPTSTQPYIAEAAAGPEAIKRAVPVPRHALPRTPTIVVRRPGPTKQQKLIVFMAMLLLFVGGGIVFLLYGRHLGLDFYVGANPPRVTTPATTVIPPAPTVAPSTVAAAVASSAVALVVVAAPVPSASAVVTAAPSVTPTLVPPVKRTPRPQPRVNVSANPY